jgi:hypothetical protein
MGLARRISSVVPPMRFFLAVVETGIRGARAAAFARRLCLLPALENALRGSQILLGYRTAASSLSSPSVVSV